MKGKLLSLEGISGTGKTFYREQLEKNINNQENILFIKEIFNETQEGLNQKIFSALYHTEDRFFNMGVPLTETMLLLSRSMYKYESTIRQALEDGISLKVIKRYANGDFEFNQLKEIFKGFKHGLSQDEVDKYARAEFFYYEMWLMRLGYEKGFDEKKILLYTNRKFSQDQMYQIYKGAKHGLTLKQLKVYAKEEFDYNQMFIIRTCLERGYKASEIDFDMIRSLNSLDDIYADFLEDNLEKGFEKKLILR